MNSAIALALAASLALTANTSFASDWRETAGSSDGRRAFVDVSRVVQEGKFRKAWQRSEWPTEQTFETLKYRSVLQLNLYDCQARRMATRTMHIYAAPGATGKLVKAIDIQDSRLQWIDIPPESGLEGAYTVVCGL